MYPTVFTRVGNYRVHNVTFLGDHIIMGSAGGVWVRDSDASGILLLHAFAVKVFTLVWGGRAPKVCGEWTVKGTQRSIL